MSIEWASPTDEFWQQQLPGWGYQQRGEEQTAEVVARLGAMAEPARELAYRLYRICDQKNRPQEALAYNALIQSWPELASLARQQAPAQQGTLLAPVEEA